MFVTRPKDPRTSELNREHCTFWRSKTDIPGRSREGYAQPGFPTAVSAKCNGNRLPRLNTRHPKTTRVVLEARATLHM